MAIDEKKLVEAVMSGNDIGLIDILRCMIYEVICDIIDYREILSFEQYQAKNEKTSDNDVIETNVGKWIPVHKHMWKKGYDGKIDEWVWENGFHNGPQCELCYATPCVHCNPDWEASECREISYECSECQTHVKDMTNYCPHCGVRMMPEP